LQRELDGRDVGKCRWRAIAGEQEQGGVRHIVGMNGEELTVRSIVGTGNVSAGMQAVAAPWSKEE
jgi:hypothetical protein